MKKNLAVWTLFGLAFVANPNLACSSSSEEDDFTYSEADMKAAVLGDWQGTAEIDGETIPFTLTLEQASSTSTTQSVSAPPFQPQCGSRSFVKPAAACISMSSMPLVVTLTSDSPVLSGAVTGSAQGYRTLDSLELELEIEDGPVLHGSIKEQTLTEGIIWDTADIGTFTLARP